MNSHGRERSNKPVITWNNKQIDFKQSPLIIPWTGAPSWEANKVGRVQPEISAGRSHCIEGLSPGLKKKKELNSQTANTITF